MLEASDDQDQCGDRPSVDSVLDILKTPALSEVVELRDQANRIRDMIGSVLSALDCIPRLFQPQHGFGTGGGSGSGRGGDHEGAGSGGGGGGGGDGGGRGANNGGVDAGGVSGSRGPTRASGETINETWRKFMAPQGSEILKTRQVHTSCNEAWKLADKLMVPIDLPQRVVVEFVAGVRR